MGGDSIQAMFVLFFPARVPQAFAGFTGHVDGVDALPADHVQARTEQLHDVEVALLGTEYLKSRRITRWPLGRAVLPMHEAPAQEAGTGPHHADLFLVTHTAGVGVWEAWISLPDEPLDARRFVSWLRSGQGAGPAAVLRERIASATRQFLSDLGTDEAFAFTILRRPGDEPPFDALVAEHADDLIRLLYLDQSDLAFKRRTIEEELDRDFCLRENGISLLSARAALDLRIGEGLVTDPVSGTVLAPRSALPLLISVELLLIERAVLRLFHRRLVGTGVPESLSRLVELKAEVLDGLAEYRGTVAESNRFSYEVTAYGEQVLGLDVLYRTLVERLDALTFEITTGYQQSTNVLQFSLTVVLGSFQASSVAAVIAAVHYVHEPLLVLAWAGGVGLAAASAIAAILRRRLH